MGGNAVNLRLTSTDASLAHIDLVQIVHAPTWTGAGPASGPCGCVADIDRNGSIDGSDLAIVLTAWGTDGQQGGIDVDLDDSGVVDGTELGLVLSSWGPCAR
jgi:hypothetical protein